MVCQFCGLPMDDCSCRDDASEWMESEEKIRNEAIEWANQFCDVPEVLPTEGGEYNVHEYLCDLMEVKILFSHSVDNVLEALRGLLQMPIFTSKDETKMAQSEFFKELNDVFLRFVSGVATLTQELESSPGDCDCEDCQDND